MEQGGGPGGHGPPNFLPNGAAVHLCPPNFHTSNWGAQIKFGGAQMGDGGAPQIWGIFNWK